jgi:hypothetical protein
MTTSRRALRIIMALSLFSLVPAAFAQTVGGAFRIDSEKGALTIEFSATGLSAGRASGDLALTQPLALPDQDVDGAGDPEIKETTLSLRVAVDCLKVERNRAVLGGQVRDSNVQSYVGRRMLLTVQDNADAEEPAPDLYAFGLYGATSPTWVPSDAELKFDPGVGMTWIATDAERDDDKGISSKPREQVDCEAFTLASYELEELPKDGGDIQVKP